MFTRIFVKSKDPKLQAALKGIALSPGDLHFETKLEASFGLHLGFSAKTGLYYYNFAGQLEELPAPLRDCQIAYVELYKPNMPATTKNVLAGKYLHPEVPGYTATIDKSFITDNSRSQTRVFEAWHFTVHGPDLAEANQYLRELRRGDHTPIEAAE